MSAKKSKKSAGKNASPASNQPAESPPATEGAPQQPVRPTAAEPVGADESPAPDAAAAIAPVSRGDVEPAAPKPAPETPPPSSKPSQRPEPVPVVAASQPPLGASGETGAAEPAPLERAVEGPVSAQAVEMDPFDVARPEVVYESMPAEPALADPALEGEAAPPSPSPAEASPETIPEPQVSTPRIGPMYIVQITPELAPVAKVGGMADVVSGLSRELSLRGNTVEIILPKYNNMRYDHIWGLHGVYDDLWVPWYGGHVHCSVLEGSVHGRTCFFIDAHSSDNFFNRGVYYGCHDDIMRFAFFSRAALEFLYKSGKHPEIIHCHDWPTGLVPVMLYEIYQWVGMSHSRVCYTIHNFRHQGTAGANLLYATGLNRPEHFFQHSQLGDNNNRHAVNMMKGGIVYANFVTTVSPHHAWEAKDQGQGHGLESTLHAYHTKYGGIVNGVDYDYWNPEIDHYIPHHYGADSIEGKYHNKAELRRRLLLADGPMPIIAFVGRLDPQKGLDLVRHGLFFALGNSAQFVLLGSSPDAGINGEFWGLKQHLNNNPDCHLEIGFNEELAHLIYAGADMMIVPSRYEPCGLTQLISLRYGTVPIVRSVGGLADTVFDKDYCDRPLHERNGYVFADATPDGLAWAMNRAISCYYQYPQDFRALMLNGMRMDYSWNHPAQHYLNVYEHIRNK